MTFTSSAGSIERGVSQRFPVVGIVTPVRNRLPWSVAFCRMMDTQDYPVFKLYIVDSSSTDGTPAALEALRFPFLKVLRAPESYYWGAATNLGVRQALDDGCEFILTINDDAIVAQDYLSRLMASVVATNAKIVGSVIAYVDEPGRLWAVGAYNNWAEGAFVQLNQGNIWEDLSDLSGDLELLPVDYLSGNGSLFHRSVYEAVGLYNEKWTPHYHADSELTMRAERAGIERWVSPAARVYNRFSEASDGGTSARNRRFFSFRSANYLRATLYVLDQYCPTDLKSRALVRYYAKYLRQDDWRIWSRMVRLVRFLGAEEDHRRADIKSFFPPLDPVLCAAEDLAILLTLPAGDFVVMAYANLLRRAASDAEYAHYAEMVSSGQSRAAILERFVNSGEFMAVQPALRGFLLALLRLPKTPKRGSERGTLAPREAWIVDQISEHSRVPSVAEAAGRLAPIKDDPPALHAHHGGLKVYFNIDMLCVATTDPAAEANVARYVSALLTHLARLPTIDLEMFHSAPMAESCAKLIREGKLPDDLRFAPPHGIMANGVVFYPDVPLDKLDVRFDGLGTVMTVCDVLPLIGPQWFSERALVSYRRRMHALATADHIICISNSAEQALKQAIPGLTVATSVVPLGIDRPEARTAERAKSDVVRTRGDRRPRYVLCVGTTRPRENVVSAIAAMELLSHADVPDCEMWVVGEDGWSIPAAELSKRAGTAAGQVRFLGEVENAALSSLYADARCTVFPALGDGFGFPIGDSLAAGTPVIAGRGSAMAELCGQAAILVDPMNTAELADAIRRRIMDGHPDAVSESQSLDAADIRAWEKCASEHASVFKKLAREKGARSADSGCDPIG
ncbi:glycosyltransferase [Sphingomonas glacialis]|uniref:Glycosyltransferase n=1 Tax=Sphingomonas glacialis TaxID=658225 RepID=A0A502FR50_9SPHN|nr:glycosyltransferase [Sphingomonas glacialis]TPG51626.1 glycosyltransferase [Sphingomonas glacialis]